MKPKREPVPWVIEKVLTKAELSKRKLGDRRLNFFHITRAIVELERTPLRVERVLDKDTIWALTPYVGEEEIKQILRIKNMPIKTGGVDLVKLVRMGADLLHKLSNPFKILTEDEVKNLIDIHFGERLNDREKAYLIKILTGKRNVSDPHWIEKELVFEIVDATKNGEVDRAQTLKGVLSVLRLKGNKQTQEGSGDLRAVKKALQEGELDHWIKNKRILVHVKNELKKILGV